MHTREVLTTRGPRALAAFRSYKFSTLALMAVIIVISAAASAQTHTGNTSGPQNVNVVNTPSVSATVSNTASNPVQSVDVEKLARIPFQFFNSCGGSGCQVLINLNKPGYRTVLENVSASFILPAGTTEAPMVVVDNSSRGGRWALVAKLGPTVNGQIWAGLNEKLLAYFDATDNSSIFPLGNPGTPVLVTLTGYYENCAITGCPPIM